MLFASLFGCERYCHNEPPLVMLAREFLSPSWHTFAVGGRVPRYTVAFGDITWDPREPPCQRLREVGTAAFVLPRQTGFNLDVSTTEQYRTVSKP